MAMSERDIARAFARVERMLIASLVRNLRRHRVAEASEGFQWVQWQAEQLAALIEYSRDNGLRGAKVFSALNRAVRKLIEVVYDRHLDSEEQLILEAADEGWEPVHTRFFEVPRERLDAISGAVAEDLERAEHAVLRRADDQYRKIIYSAQVYAASGAGTYEQAVDMATRDFLSKGVDGIVYRNGSRHTITEYANMAVRTAVKRAAFVAEGDMRRQWGVHTVMVDYRDDACPECMAWVGEVLVDDVYSGGTEEEAMAGGWALLSEAMEAGLFHPNCRDTMSTYFPGVSTLPERPSEAAQAVSEAREAAEQEENAAKSNAARYGRLAEYSLDPSNKAKYNAMEREWQTRAEDVQASVPGNAGAAADITEGEARAVEWYVSGEGMYINHGLRGRLADLTEGDMEKVALLDSATDAEISHGTLWRSVDASAVLGPISQAEYERLCEGLTYGASDRYAEAAVERAKGIVGKTFEERGFMSTTLDRELAFDWRDFSGSDKPAILEIKGADKARGLDIGKTIPELEERMGQSEVLLKRGTMYRITGVKAEEGQPVFEAYIVEDSQEPEPAGEKAAGVPIENAELLPEGIADAVSQELAELLGRYPGVARLQSDGTLGLAGVRALNSLQVAEETGLDMSEVASVAGYFGSTSSGKNIGIAFNADLAKDMLETRGASNAEHVVRRASRHEFAHYLNWIMHPADRPARDALAERIVLESLAEVAESDPSAKFLNVSDRMLVKLTVSDYAGKCFDAGKYEEVIAEAFAEKVPSPLCEAIVRRFEEEVGKL